jgi:uncharacterized membrane protein YdjX (TVP38/TMEM64 family)
MIRLIGKSALMLIGLTGAVLALHLLPFGSILKSHAQADWSDTAIFVAVGALACAVGMPRQIVAFAAGFAWGAVMGGALALLAQVIGCVVDFYWARLVGRDFVQARLRGRALKLERTLTRQPFVNALTLRLMPVGNNLLLNVLAGVSAVPARGFVLGSAIGFIPQTAIFALLGSGSRIARSTQIGLGIGLFVLSTVIGIILLRRQASTAPPLAKPAE